MYKSHRAEWLLVGAALTYAFNGVVSKWVLETGLSSIRLTEIRTLGAVVFIGSWVLIKNPSSLKIPLKQLPEMLLFGLIAVAGVQAFYFYSISKMPVSVALLIEFTAPIWITIYLRFIKKESVAKSMWYGLTLGFGGLILLAQVWKGLTLNGLGVISGFLDALSLAYYYYKASELTKKMTSEAVLTWGMGVCSLLLSLVQPWWSFPFKVFAEQIPLNGHFAGHGLPGWILILWIVLPGTVLPYVLVIRGISGLNPATASTIGMLEPISAGIFAWILLNESLNLIQLIGAATVLVGIYFADRASTSTH